MKQFSNLMQRFLLVMLAMSTTISIDAHHFSAPNEDGVVIYYKIISETDKTCEVTYRGTSYNSYDDEYSGAVKIPETAIGYKVTSIGYSAFYGCFGLTSITIPSSVTTIGQEAFSGCTGLTSVVISFSVTTIGQSAFSGCTGLTSVVISSSVTTIGQSAFSGCTGLTSITIPNSVTSIGYRAFWYCTGLTSITIPSSVTTIEQEAFSGTAWYNNQPNGLVYAGKVAYQYKGTMPDKTSITLIEGTKGIAYSAFSGCTGLTSITIPSSVQIIGGSAFSGCTGLTSITIPSSVTTIGGIAFYNCLNLREIIFNSSPQIGSDAFSRDDRISFIYINSTTAPYLVNKTFSDEVYQYAYLHIPMGCYEEFSSAYGWRNFNRIKEDLDVNGTTYYTSLRIKQSDLGYVDQYVKVDEEYTVYIAPEGNRRINTVLFNGVDVTEQLVDGYYTTPIIKGRSVLSVSYEEMSNDVKEIPVSSLKVYGYNGVLYIKDAEDNATLNVYDIDGKLVYNATIANGEATIQLPSSEIYAVKVGERTIKVAL